MKNSGAAIPNLDDIRETLTPILKERGVKKAIVFGSYARGEADEYSDLDLIVVAESDLRFLQRHKDFRGIFKVWRKGLDLLIYTPEELTLMSANPNPFIEHALGEGVVIYEE